MKALHPIRHVFADAEALAGALADAVSSHLTAAIEARGMGLIAVSGGHTPVRFFEALSQREIDWPNVTVTLVDERFVPPSSERSNQHLVAAHLLKGAAAKARFVGLYHEVGTVEAAAALAAEEIGALPQPFDVVILGMGADGHTASFFPDAQSRQTLMSPEEKRTVLPVHAPSAGEPRLTLSLPVLSAARFAVLHIEGEEKKTALERAMISREEPPPPIRTVVDAMTTPIAVYWAPDKDPQP